MIFEFVSDLGFRISTNPTSTELFLLPLSLPLHKVKEI
jgi:hypothetical protein